MASAFGSYVNAMDFTVVSIFKLLSDINASELLCGHDHHHLQNHDGQSICQLDETHVGDGLNVCLWGITSIRLIKKRRTFHCGQHHSLG